MYDALPYRLFINTSHRNQTIFVFPFPSHPRAHPICSSNPSSLPSHLLRALTPINIPNLLIPHPCRIHDTLEIPQIRHQLLMDRRHIRTALIPIILHHMTHIALIVLLVLLGAVRRVVNLCREHVGEILSEALLHRRLELFAWEPCGGVVGGAGT